MNTKKNRAYYTFGIILISSFLLQSVWARRFPYNPTKTQRNIVREKININRDWKFKLGDYPDAENADYDDNSWDDVNLPHNFSIPYFQSSHWYTGYGWYRKYFTIDPEWVSKRISVEFEGAFREAEIYVNGKLAGTHHGGYTGFSIDITGLLKQGKNVLAVRLNNNWNAALAPRNGDYNFTGGIYRDVYLVVTDNVHITWNGTYITTPELSQKSGKVDIQTEVKNDGNDLKEYTLQTDILDPSGEIAASVITNQRIAPDSTVVFRQITAPINDPALWSPQHPSLYKAVSKIFDGKKLIDSYSSKFGFRWMRWTADSGFFLNGSHYYFKGADVHQDHAGWGTAITNAAIVRDVKMIKDCGMDFIRGSHYPHDPAFADACDSLGILLWCENDFWGSGGNQKDEGNWYNGAGAYPPREADRPGFEQSVKSDLEEMIRINRNHPSVIVWSMCNEPFFTGYGTMDKVKEFLKELVELTHKLDPTRPAGIGGCQRGDIDKIGDIAGYNGDGARLFINPGIPNVVTEYGSTIAIRPGPYTAGLGDMESQQDSNYIWRSGQALWCAFDYGTRAGDFGKMGMVDYFRLPKNMYYWYVNENRHIPPPKVAKEGIPDKLCLMADKKTINGTNGTDDVFLTVSVLDKNAEQLSNSPDVTLQIVSGPGEFPTGNSITFSNKSDIYIRDGKAAIEFRSYYGGTTVIKAISKGLKSDSITITTKGHPLFVQGVTPSTGYRPYTPYISEQAAAADTSVNIAFPKPTNASSEIPGKTANLANDKNPATYWQPELSDKQKWWEVDMENLYKVTQVRLLFASVVEKDYTIELSKDHRDWNELASSASGNSYDGSKEKIFDIPNKSVGRFLRIKFTGVAQKNILLKEVDIRGIADN